MASPPVLVDDEIMLYDSVAARNHHAVPAPHVEAGIRVWALKRDRWMAYSADERRGELLTQVVPRPPCLSLNAAVAPEGFVRVEITDAHGKALEGLSLEESVPLSGDGLALVPTWTTGKQVAAAPEERVRLRITARGAKLFGIGGIQRHEQ